MSETKNSHLEGVRHVWWHWTLGGALYGLFLRVLFGTMPQAFGGVMSFAFLVGAPFVAGALTVYGLRHTKPSLCTQLFRPWVTVSLMLVGCAITLLEGSICIALMAPLFLACSSVGGFSMGLALTLFGGWHSHLRSVALLPLLMLIGESLVPMGNQELEIRQSVYVDAAPSIVWAQIMNARAIQPEELPLSLTHFIGVPKPLEGLNVNTPDGEIRYSKWERGVNFRSKVTHRIENESIRWEYVFDKNSFPEGSMDDHVAIGGRYFDLHDTTFNLRKMPSGQTQLEIVAHYRVTSSVNFYAIPAANVLGQDFVATILELYKRRSERVQVVGNSGSASDVFTKNVTNR